MTRAVLALWAVCALAACKKSDDAAPAWSAPPVMESAEQERGLQACDAYVARVCRCAEADPDALGEQCRLASEQPAALRTTLSLLNGDEGQFGPDDARALQATARRIIKDCFEADVALDPKTCPR